MKTNTNISIRARARTNWRPILLCAAMALGLLLNAGCLYLDQAIVLREDGSCTVTYRYSVPEDAVPNLATAQRVIEQWQGRNPGPDSNDLQWCFSRPAVSRHFAGRGLTLKGHRIYEKDGRRYAEITVNADNAWAALESGKFGPFQLSRTAEGDYRLRADIPEDPAAKPPTPEQRDKLRALCEGLSLTLTLETPTKIISTSSTAASGKKATWVFDPRVDDTFLAKTPVIDLTFSGKDLNWDRKK
ncbi:MAG: hypothetical protein A3K19_08315 [Lentisphaerae bacterium RIFOXYB12_FULL_65_16]|nr:MAG: hypothetical protein A3K18_00315 [Lentisphaerae bacterium RIFOXYA12_64_32]OGV89873.1 MAG: hypothetical protein A3K19_08315 [Lentisphaerae bacterium RIFOXYB12_FULL_65_16]